MHKTNLAFVSSLALTLASPLAAQSYDPVTMTWIGNRSTREAALPPSANSATGNASFAAGNILVGSDVTPDTLLDINPARGGNTTIGKLGDPVVAALAWDSTNKILYASSTSTNKLLRIDPATAKTTVIGSFGGSIRLMHGLAYNLRNNTLYGATSFGTNQLFTLNKKTGAATVVGVHGLMALGDLAYDFVGNKMYASDIRQRALYTLDLKTGKATLVGAFGVGMQVGVSLEYEITQGLFASDNLGSNKSDDVLYQIDTKTGKATKIGDMLAGNVLGLAFVDSCMAAASRGYGTGFPGTSGTPKLRTTAPVIGKSMNLTMSNTRGVATAGLLIVNLVPAEVPAFWGGTLLVSLNAAILLSVPVLTTGLSMNFSVPANAPCAVSVYTQGLLIDPGAKAGLASSAGREMRVGL